MLKHANVVIVGAGIVGTAAAYHLARLGWRDIVVLDKGAIPENDGSTSHAPGGVVAITRLVLTSLFLLVWTLSGGAVGPEPGTLKYWIGISSFVLGIAYSSWVLSWFHHTRTLRVHLVVSVVIDAVIIPTTEQQPE